ncbi:MAG TPA: hypothetical protein VN706_10210 [Gemmatimonadaceae bacterium]|jgi:uncharacterized membrane protein YjfL (UPF0719 family)|nr:hypothetical protein [Gemmatimonadaceae bacterium]
MAHSGPIYQGEPPQQQQQRATYTNRSVSVAKAGASFGSALAIAISWDAHHSLIWAIIDGFLSWVYVLYFAITR